MSSWIDRYIYPRPTEERLYVERTPVDGVKCPRCQSSDVRRYPIANYLGPYIVTKCQDCFYSLKTEVPGPEDKWPPFRSVSFDWPASLAERASREILLRQDKQGDGPGADSEDGSHG